MEIWSSILTVAVIVIAFMQYSLNKKISAENLEPRLQIMPTKFQPRFPIETQCGIHMQITNHTNFPAFNVTVDTQYPVKKGSNLRLTVAGYFDIDTSCPGH